MGLKDTAAKNFFGRADILATLLDIVLYDGQPTVKAEQLRETCGEHYRIEKDEAGKYKTDNRFRDKLFEYDTGDGRVSVGLELQSRNDKRMVLRIMRYDCRRYFEMLPHGQLNRIVNIVLSFDRSRHRPASNLKEMTHLAPAVADEHFYNYGFISLNIYDLAVKSELFPCNELKEVLNYFRVDQDSGKFVKALTEGVLKGCLSRDAALVCAVFLGLEIDIDNEAEEIDMCKAIRDFKRECIKEGKKLGLDEGKKLGLDEGKKLGLDEGKKLGLDEGMKIGEENAIKRIVQQLLRMSYSLLDICTITGVSEEIVQEIVLATQQ